MTSKRAMNILERCRATKPYCRPGTSNGLRPPSNPPVARRNLALSFTSIPSTGGDPGEDEEAVDDIPPVDAALTGTPSTSNSVIVPDPPANSETTPRVPSKCPRPSVRKRVPQPKNYKTAIAKEALNAGREHETPRGLFRAARVLKPSCKISCNRCHKRRLTEEERAKIFKNFWELENTHRKRDFLSRCITCQTPKTCFTLPERARKATRTYSFIVDNEEIRVCKTNFLNTLDLCDQWIKTTLNKVEDGTGLKPDGRGRHNNRPRRWGLDVINRVKRHIESFPRVYSHYTRANTKREYLETGLSIQRMYRMYRARASLLGWQKFASSRLYRRIFTQNYNFGFFLPRKDQCELCNRWRQAKNKQERLEMVEEFKLHLLQRKAVKSLKASDIKSAGPKMCVSCFDLQKVLICPRSDTSLFFYRNKLSIFNFTIFEVAPKPQIGHCFVWNETEAKKGSNEIGTCVFNFIQKKVETEGCTDFCFYSDSPTGQNRNRMVYSMYLLASAKFGVNITHRYLESGHSYSEADSMHARIENEALHKSLFSQSEWLSHIQNAKLEGEPYRVQLLGNQDVMDLKYLVNLQCWDKDSQNRAMRWTQIREIACRSGHPNKLYYRYKLFDEIPKEVSVFMKDRSELDMVNFNPPKAYDRKFPLSQEKIADLKWLCQKKAIPTIYHSFYEEIFAVR